MIDLTDFGLLLEAFYKTTQSRLKGFSKLRRVGGTEAFKLARTQSAGQYRQYKMLRDRMMKMKSRIRQQYGRKGLTLARRLPR